MTTAITTEDGVKLDGTWTSEMLRALADVVDIVNRIPEDKRQEALERAQAMLEKSRKFPGLKLVWDNPHHREA